MASRFSQPAEHARRKNMVPMIAKRCLGEFSICRINEISAE